VPAGRIAPLDALPVDETFLSNHIAPALADPREVDGEFVAGTLNNYLGEKPTYAFSREYADVWAPELRRFLLVRLYGAIARATREGLSLDPAPAVVIKEVNGSHAADVVMPVLRGARILHLVRDGRDVVDSLLAAYRPGGFLARNQGRAIETADERAEAVAWASRTWSLNVDATERAMAEHSPELVRTLRYEDLLADPGRELGPLFGWLGLERDRGWLERMIAERSFARIPERARGEHTRNRSAQPGLWRENLSRSEQRVATETMGPRLERYGYEV
jgi:hypothetical protein